MPRLTWWRRSPSRPPMSMVVRPVRMCCRPIPARSLLTAPIGAVISVTPSEPKAARRASWRRACSGHGATEALARLEPETGPSIACEAGTRKSSAHGSEAMAFVACDGQDWQRPPFRSVSPPSPITSNVFWRSPRFDDHGNAERLGAQSKPDGHDAPGLLDKGVPGVAQWSTMSW